MASSVHFLLLVSFLARLSFVLGSPIDTAGGTLQERDSLPLLNLSYATYRAADYSSDNDIYTFKNIRYAQPPVGDLRWAKPVAPAKNSTIQDGSYGPHCVQSSINGLNVAGSGNKSPIGADINQFVAGLPLPNFRGGDEDCLFLDLYVPGKAIKDPSIKLPVVVFVHGGGYVFGSKDSLTELGFYSGVGLIEQSNNNIIYVSFNYRLGAFGFLAGTTMEKDGLPNAGFWDQMAVFQWVQDNIAKVGGDPTRVTAMGESAGGGSILHHLTFQGGKRDPLFKQAIIQSPAFELMWDRNGVVEQTFQNFTKLAKCDGKGLACLRSADAGTLSAANTALNMDQTIGSFAVGPTPDGSLLRQMASLELATGNFWTNISSLILSHVAHEPNVFVNGHYQTDDAFSGFLNSIFPSYAATSGINAKIEAFYPSTSTANSPFTDEVERMEAFMRDSCFTCNVRYLTEAVGDNKVWNMQYSVSPGLHATDLIPTFFSTGASITNVLADIVGDVPIIGKLFEHLARGMQSYFTSYIVTGDPNTNRVKSGIPSTVQWDHPDSGKGEQISGVVDVGDLGFHTVDDDQNEKTPCDFWKDFAEAVTILGGYVPPGVTLSQKFVQAAGNASANYVGGNAH